MIDKSSEKIEKMFDKIAPNYDKINNLISFYTHYRIKKYAIKALKIKPCSKVLDLCSGSGDMGIIVKQLEKSANVVGVDFSSEMIKIAKNKTKDINFIQANAQDLPFKDNCFDYVICAFGIRNIENQTKAINEIYRVLKPEGLFLHLDFAKSPVGFIWDWIIYFFIQNFFENKDSYKYLINSKNEFFSPRELVLEFEKAGFHTKTVKSLLFNIISFQITQRHHILNKNIQL